MFRFILLLLTLGIGTASHAAMNRCSEVLVDEGYIVLTQDRAVIHKDIEGLVSLGADVRIHLMESTGDMSLADYRDSIIRECSSWRTSSGGLKTNIIAIIVSIDPPRTGVYFGSGWQTELNDARVESIIANSMNPLFVEGRWTDGLRFGLRGIETLISSARAGNIRWLAYVLVLVGLIVLLVFVAVFFMAMRRDARNSEWERCLMSIRINAGRLHDQRSKHARYSERLDLLKDYISKVEFERVHGVVTAVQAFITRAEAESERLQNLSFSERPTRSVEDEIRSQSLGLNRSLDEIDDRLQSVRAVFATNRSRGNTQLQGWNDARKGRIHAYRNDGSELDLDPCGIVEASAPSDGGSSGSSGSPCD